MVEHFKQLWRLLNIEYDHFIRTTDEEHIKGVQKIFTKVKEKGDIYLGEYSGHYCISCENFIPDSAEETTDGKRTCPECGRPTDNRVKEKCYFFRLSAYGDKLLKFFEENPDFVTPRSRMNEVVSFVKMGLRDLSVTRSTVKWGVPVPGDEQQTIYVWFDALSNYITAIDYLNEGERFRHVLAGRPAHHGQGHPQVPRRVLAGVPDGRRAAPAQKRTDPRLVAEGRKENVQVQRAMSWIPTSC